MKIFSIGCNRGYCFINWSFILPVGIASLAGGFGAADFGSFENLGIGLAVLTIIIILNNSLKELWVQVPIFIGTMIGFIFTLLIGKVDLTSVIKAD